MKFKVGVTEVLSWSATIEAKDKEEAIVIARRALAQTGHEAFYEDQGGDGYQIDAVDEVGEEEEADFDLEEYPED